MLQTNQIRLIPLAAVINMTGLSKTSCYTIVDFPRPIKIKGAGATAQGGARWVEGEVVEWMKSRIHARDTQPRPIDLNLFRGRPTNIERAESARLGLSIRELRAQTKLTLEVGAA